MPSHKTITTLISILLTACTPQTDDLNQFIADVANTPPTAIEPYPTFETQPAFQYSVAHLRSPFQRKREGQQTVIKEPVASCLQPNTQRTKMPLERFGVDALKVMGFLNSEGKTWGIISASDGKLYKVTLGDRLGLFFGEITRISNNTIHFTELLPDGTGCWKTKASKLSLAQSTGENNDV
ncbi:pilus assembly protein PilP [Alteromonas sp. a30]|uniref:pilus assembly protein PilP n=1 Tax=Alteromonas sp. a30 TaxID=2730917 RepID=UPI00227EC367|nr:pilus assembly protein PilP [Alteromonas sp. a30]MCY7295300.1 pilus assembly protein PilP [Alteromonas sp. a30]